MAQWDGASLTAAWNAFLETLDPFRADLHRFCRRLTGDPWDAEDLIQDTLEQAFAGLARAGGEIGNPRAYVLRIASNLWVSRVRRTITGRAVLADIGSQTEDTTGPSSTEQAADVSAAAGRLLGELSPQERAAVVLKEVFDLSLAETAEALATTTGAVKAALSRGRRRLRELETTPRGVRHSVSQPVVERFAALFNARDRDGLLELMLDSASVEMSPVETCVGRAAISREPGWLFFNLRSPSRWEVAVYRDEPLVLVLSPTDPPQVGSVMRLETVDDHVARIRVYAFCPDTVREVAAALGRPAAPMGIYRFSPELLRQLARTSS